MKVRSHAGLVSFLTLAVAGIVPMAANAQSADMKDMVAKADANKDGNITWAEITALRTSSFERLDRNSDGVINSADRPRGPMAGRFDQALVKVQTDFDTDRDGEITQNEMLTAPAPLFERGDVDGDGVLTSQEMAALAPDTAAQ